MGRAKPKERFETSEFQCRAVGMTARAACAVRLDEARLPVGSCQLPRVAGPAHRSAGGSRYHANSTDCRNSESRGEGEGTKGNYRYERGLPQVGRWHGQGIRFRPWGTILAV